MEIYPVDSVIQPLDNQNQSEDHTKGQPNSWVEPYLLILSSALQLQG